MRLRLLLPRRWQDMCAPQRVGGSLSFLQLSSRGGGDGDNEVGRQDPLAGWSAAIAAGGVATYFVLQRPRGARGRSRREPGPSAQQ